MLHKQCIGRRAMQAWGSAVEHAQQLASVRGLRDTIFRLWRGRARDKSAIASTVSARMKLKCRGWPNEVRPEIMTDLVLADAAAHDLDLLYLRSVERTQADVCGRNLHMYELHSSCWQTHTYPMWLQSQYCNFHTCQKCLSQWRAPWLLADTHRRRSLLRKSILGLSQGVFHTQQLLAPHHEYWRQGMPLLKAWRAWTSVTQMKRYIRVRW